MGNSFGKNNYQFRISNLILKIRRTLGKYLTFTTVFFTNLLVLTMHTIMSANYYNIQNINSFIRLIWLVATNSLVKNIFYSLRVIDTARKKLSGSIPKKIFFHILSIFICKIANTSKSILSCTYLRTFERIH